MRVAFEGRILQRANKSLFRWNDRDDIALTDSDAALGLFQNQFLYGLRLYPGMKRRELWRNLGDDGVKQAA